MKDCTVPNTQRELLMEQSVSYCLCSSGLTRLHFTHVCQDGCRKSPVTAFAQQDKTTLPPCLSLPGLGDIPCMPGWQQQLLLGCSVGCEIPAGNTGILWCELMPEMELLRYPLAPLHFYPLFPSGFFPFSFYCFSLCIFILWVF